MIAENFIRHDAPTIEPHLPCEAALTLLKKQQINDLPVVFDNEYYVGIFSNQKPCNPNAAISQAIMPESELWFVYQQQHIFDALHLLLTYNLAIVPVLDEDKKYYGAITQKSLLTCFGQIATLDEQGDTIILEISRHDYSLTKIASIIESHNSKVLNVFITQVPEDTTLFLNLKISGAELTSIVHSLERFGYKVAYFFSEQKYLNATEERFSELMMYLNV